MTLKRAGVDLVVWMGLHGAATSPPRKTTAICSLPTNLPSPKTLQNRAHSRPVLTIVSPFCQGELELFQSAEFPPTYGLTQNAESSRSRRFVFSASHARTYVESVVWREFSKIVRCALRSPHWPQLAPQLSRSLVNRPLWVNNPVGFGPRKQPVAETC